MDNNIEAIDSIYKSNEKRLLDEGFYSSEQVEFLKNNYNITKEKILNSDIETIDKVSDQLIEIMEAIPDDENYNASLAESILLYYNFYRVYGKDLFSVNVDNMTLAMNVFENFINNGSKSIEDMDYVIYPIVAYPDLITKLKDSGIKNNMVAHYVEEMVSDNNKKPSRKEVEKVFETRVNADYSHK